MATTTTRLVGPQKLANDLAKKADLVAGKVAAAQLPDAFNAVAPTIVTIPYAATITPDASKGIVQRCDLTGSVTVAAPTNPTEGQQLLLQFTASAGARQVTLATGSGGSFQFGTDVTSLPPIASGRVQYIGVIYRSRSARWDVVTVANGFLA